MKVINVNYRSSKKKQKVTVSQAFELIDAIECEHYTTAYRESCLKWYNKLVADGLISQGFMDYAKKIRNYGS